MEDFKDLSPENYPRAAKLFAHEFFWDCTDELAPFGNDNGADTLAFLQEWRAESPDGEPLVFLEDLLTTWNVFNNDWEVLILKQRKVCWMKMSSVF